MGGQGIALGWRHLTDRLVESGLLVQVTDHVMRTGKAFHVVWPKNRELSTSARKVRDWLAAQA
jgi:DNA-binding transcriptional LysR family regulator